MTGVNIKVRVGSTIYRVRKVTVNETVGEIDETDGESGGFGECEDSGVTQADVTLEGWVRSADTTPPLPGDLLTSVNVCWDGVTATPTVNKRHNFPKLKILAVQREGEVKGGSISYTLTCKSSGTYKSMGVA